MGKDAVQAGLQKCLGFAVAAVFAGSLLSGCGHSENRSSGADAAQAAQAAAAQQKQEDDAVAARKGIRAAEVQLDQLPPPSKRSYLNARTPDQWKNPFIIVGQKTLMLRVVDPQTSDVLPNGVLPDLKWVDAPHGKREMTLRLIDLPEVLAALPEESWVYGRVVTVDEDPSTPRRERPAMRRNVEAVMAMLNDLDVVVNEWPGGSR